MREKESVEVILNDFETNPKCPKHGPTVLFASKSQKYFSCSCDRSKDCFYLEYDKFLRIKDQIESGNETETSKNEGTIKEFDLRKDPDQRFFCITCDEFTVDSQKSHKSHQVKKVSDDNLQNPSLFLPQLNNDKVNAQYFFDNTTLGFIDSVLDSLQLDHVICIGAPRLHDYLRNKSSKKSLLLDIDKRFQPFYPEEFCHYNMFNNYFFNGKKDEDKLEQFLKNSNKDEKSHHCLFTDPPFAARTELLTHTIRTISSLYFRMNHKLLPVFWIFPYFNECHIKKYMPEMEMLDYQVTYMNHHAFNNEYKGRKEGSVVRIFTNIPQNLIKYPTSMTDYRFCKPCNRFVSKSNLHCNICKICPSKNGATYRHCKLCRKCMKPNYKHCSTCDRCTVTNHDCKEFQMHQECRKCHVKGHVEKYCKSAKKLNKK
ncbi:rRNA N(6)-adenosine-methyltransferase ZCCHC4 [Chironomus tepperi]|uniref:rRNA N(6)-adenosine-methyltransferase ZCCHC4 n=1 Tax=Chironomus tepperi TaxID=113505 RepID=UPI00391F1FCC